MGFNKKSDAGPFEGLTSQQRYMSDVIFGYYPMLINALDYQNFGCNAIFINPSFKINEAYGVNTTIDKNIIQTAEEITIEQDVLDADYSVNHDSDFTSTQTQYLYSMLTLSSYYYGANSYNHKITDFTIEPSDILSLTNQTLYYPLVPVLQPFKFLQIKTDTKMAFAMHQLQIPILRNPSTAVNSDNASVNYVKYAGNYKYNSSLYASTVIGIDNEYVSGLSSTVETNVAKWSDTASSQAGHMKGIHIEYDDSSDINGNSVMLYLFSGSTKDDGFCVGVLPNRQDTEGYFDDLNDGSSRSRAYGFIAITDFDQLISDIDAILAATGTGPLTSADGALFPLYFIKYLYYLYGTLNGKLKHIAVSCGTTTASYTNTPIQYDFDSASNGYAWYINNVIPRVISSYPALAWGIGAHYDPFPFQSCYGNSQKISAGAFAKLSDLYITESGTYTYLYPLTIRARSERQYNGTNFHTHGYKGLCGDPCDSTGIVISYNDSGYNASFHEITLSTLKDNSDLALTIGFYQDVSSLGDTTPGWVNKLLSFAAPDAYSQPVSNKRAYIISDPYDATKLNDYTLYANRHMTVFECGAATSVPTYKINNIATGMADTFSDDPAYKTTTAVNLLTPEISTGTAKSIIYVDNLKQDEEYLTIKSPNVSSLISLTSKYDLTFVRYNTYYAYFGILDIETMKHYTPKNLFNGTTEPTEHLIFEQLPTITDIKIIKSSDVILECIIKYYDNTALEDRVIYMTMQKLKNIGMGLFYNDPYYREQMILQIYRIDSQNNQILYTEPSISDHGRSWDEQLLDKAGAGIMKNIGIIESDSNIAIVNNHNSALKLNISSLTSFHNYNFLNKADIVIRDVNDFSSNAYTFPVVHPVDTLLPFNDDALNISYNTPATLSNGILCQQILYYSTMLMNYYHKGDYCLGGEARDVRTGSIIIGILPSIDKNVKNYSVLPEKSTNIYRVDDTRNLRTIGVNVFNANDKSYTEINDNLYLSSRLSMIPGNMYGLFNIQGKIFSTGNLFLITDNRQTHIYSIDENSIPKFIKTIDGIIVCDPVNIGGEIIIICNNGIHTLKQGTIYNFDINVSVADIKPITGNGYLLYIYSEDETDNVSLRAMDGTALVPMDGIEELYTIEPSDNYRVLHINDTLDVIRLEITTSGLDPSIMNVVKNNCYGSTINIYPLQEGDASVNTYIPLAYMVAEDAGNYHTAPYIISEPVQLRNQKAEKAIVDTAFLYCQGYGTIQFLLYDGAVLIVDKTITIGTNNADKYDEYKIELGMIEYDNLYYKIIMTPGLDNSLKIQTVKFRLNYLQEV